MDNRYPLSLPFDSCPNLIQLLEYDPEKINKTFHCCGGTRLHHLVSMGLDEVVLQLLNKGADVNLIDWDGQTVLIVAITEKSIKPDIVKIIAQKTLDLNIMNRKGKNALHLAVSSANSEAVKMLLQLGANIDFQDRLGNSPLHYAFQRSLDLVETLVKNGANVEVQNNNGETSLHKAVGAYKFGRVDFRQLTNIISVLLDKGSNINEQTKDGETILHILGRCWVKHPNLNELHTFLLDKGAQVHFQDKEGITPLHIAINQRAEYLGLMLKTESGKSAVNIPDNQRNYPLCLATELRDFEMVKLLLDNGAIIDIKNEFDETPLHLTLEVGLNRISEPIFYLLIERGALVSCNNLYMKTPLHIACGRAFDKQKLICKTLLTKGASPNVQDNTGMTPLHYAVESNSEEIVQLLVEYGAEVNNKNTTGETPLHVSSHHIYDYNTGLKEIICKTLLTNGASPNVQDDTGMTPLHYAVESNSKEIVQLLIENGAEINIKNTKGETPIHVLSSHNYNTGLREIICKTLLGKGALSNAQDVYGKTPLHNAAKNYSTNIVRLLIENGSEVNLKNNKGETPLHLSTHPCRDIGLQKLTCSTLIAKGALINVKDNFGMTPLHNAVKGYTTKIVQLLLENGAEINCRNKKGESPIRYVRYVETLEVLLQKGAVVNELNDYGQTALHSIAKDYLKSLSSKASRKVVKLLEWGASQNIKDKLGKLPFDYYSFTNAQKEYEIKRTCLYSTYQMERGKSNSYKFQRLLKCCFEEIDRLKLEILGKNSLYDIFRHYDDPNFLSNGELESAVLSKDLKVKFPVYRSMLTSTYLRSRVRVQLFHHVVDILQTPLPFEVIRYILTFVDDDSLKNVIKAKEEPPIKEKTYDTSISETEPDLELNSEYDSDSEYESDWEFDSDSENGYYWESDLDE